MIPTFRPPKTTPLPPNLKPVPRAVVRLPAGRGVKRSFAHFPHTLEVGRGEIALTDVEYYARFSITTLFMGATYMRITIVSSR